VVRLSRRALAALAARVVEPAASACNGYFDWTKS